MTQLDERFMDASAYHPPGKWEARITSLLVLVVAGLLLTGGWMFKDWMEDQFRYLALDETEIAIPYPPAWELRSNPDVGFLAVDPRSPSAFPPQEQVRILPLPDAALADFWPAERAATLNDYIELERTQVRLKDGRDALLLAYTYAARPNGDHTPPLVAVRAVDLVFPARYAGEDRLVVLTLAAETDDWERAWPTFQRILAKLGVTQS